MGGLPQCLLDNFWNCDGQSSRKTLDPAGLGTDLLRSVWVEKIVGNAEAAGVVGNGPGPTGFLL